MGFRRYSPEDYKRARAESERKAGDWLFINYKPAYIPREGINFIRIVPTHDDDDWANSPFGMWVYYHIIKGASFVYKLCPWTFRESCPWCEEAQKVQATGGDNTDLYARKRLIMFIIDCNEGDDMGKLKVWAAPKTIERGLWSAMDEGIDDEVPRGGIIPIEDPMEGRIISFRMSYQGRMPQYENIRIRQKFPLDAAIEEMLPHFKDVIVPSSYEELKKDLVIVPTNHIEEVDSPPDIPMDYQEATSKPADYEEYEDKLAAKVREMQRKLRNG